MPHCLKHAEGCPADYDEFGLDCKKCGACSIADFRGVAEEMGYKVLVAEGSPIVLKIIVSGYVDAIVGVACLNVLEKAIDKILLAGIPCMAVPLLSSDCRNTSVDEDWVHGDDQRPAAGRQAQSTRTYVHLMRAAANMFEPEELERLAPRLRGGPRLAEVNGQGVAGSRSDRRHRSDRLRLSRQRRQALAALHHAGRVRRPHRRQRNAGATAASIWRSFPTPSAGRRCRSRRSTKPRSCTTTSKTTTRSATAKRRCIDRYGVPTAINVGDYLIGLGYRLVSRESKTLGPDVVADILDCLADAHMRLSEGQGAELLWRDCARQATQAARCPEDLRPQDVARI